MLRRTTAETASTLDFMAGQEYRPHRRSWPHTEPPCADSRFSRSLPAEAKRRQEIKEKKKKSLEEAEETEDSEKEKTEWNLQAIRAENLDVSEDANGKIKVAVLDSGIDYVTGIDIAGSVNLVEEDEDILPIFQDMEQELQVLLLQMEKTTLRVLILMWNYIPLKFWIKRIQLHSAG